MRLSEVTIKPRRCVVNTGYTMRYNEKPEQIALTAELTFSQNIGSLKKI